MKGDYSWIGVFHVFINKFTVKVSLLVKELQYGVFLEFFDVQADF